MTDLDNARVWAECTAGLAYIGEEIQAAVDIIQSLPDQWVDVDEVREVLFHMREDSIFNEDLHPHVNALERLLTPKLPTLADMTQEELEACQWMQARLDGSELDFVIPNPGVVESMLWAKDGTTHIASNNLITPLPGEPKLGWPGSEVAEPPALPKGARLADHEEYGPVVVSQRADKDGDHMVFFSNDSVDAEHGAGWGYAHKSELTFLDGDQHA